MLFDRDTLEMLFTELGEDFNAWVSEVGYNSTWTDEDIYGALPQSIKGSLADYGLKASWMYGDL